MDTSSNMSTLAGRVASFEHPVQLSKRRASSTKKKQPNTVCWPHETPNALQLARAGFYYKPSATSVDSVTCFLCDKALDGWESEDNPILEHIAHVPDCGWAINACIELRSQEPDRVEEDPRSTKMAEARRMTFSDKWPHEAKKGWKCKVEKMVDAGWSYDPLPEADDCVKCFYCGVCLDGWEPKDDPWDEHQRRSPECAFFTLIEEANKTMKTTKPTKRRTSRLSRTARLSTQSTLSLQLEPTDTDAQDDVTLQEDITLQNDDTILTTASRNSVVGKLAKKNGKKRAPSKASRKTTPKQSSVPLHDEQDSESLPSQAGVLESVDISVTEQPASKAQGRRTTKRAASQAVEQPEAKASTMPTADTSHVASPPRKTTRARVQRKQKEAGVESSQVQTDNDDTIMSKATAPLPRGQKKKKNVEEEARADSQMPILEDYPILPPPSKMTRGKKRTSDGIEKAETSFVSAHSLSQPHGRTPKVERNEISSVQKKTKNMQKPLPQLPEPVDVQNLIVESPEPPTPQAEENKTLHRDITHTKTADPTSTVQEMENIATDEDMLQPAADLIHEPSPSQQSSDAENQPPSSRPSLVTLPGTLEAKAGAQVVEQTVTPAASPSRGNTAQGVLQSSTPWAQVDLETILLASPSPRRVHDMVEGTSMESALQGLSSAEKKMSVQEWIMWNARHAEERLRGECERMINVFEREGVRALRTLEGIECV